MRNVPQARRRRRRRRPRARSASTCPQAGDNVVACPGTSTCRLGITASQGMGARLAEQDRPATCAFAFRAATTAARSRKPGDIGIYGEGRRLHDRLVPHYQFYLGGDGMARRTPRAQGTVDPGVARSSARSSASSRRTMRRRSAGERFFDWVHAQADDYFTTLLADLVDGRAGRHGRGAARRRRRQPTSRSRSWAAANAPAPCRCSSARRSSPPRTSGAIATRSPRSAAMPTRAPARAAQLRLIGQGLHDLVNPATSFRVRTMLTDLNDIAEALAGKAPDELALAFADFAQRAGAAKTRGRSTPRCIRGDRPLGASRAAKYCVEHDPQLDLTGALPVRADARADPLHARATGRRSPHDATARSTSSAPARARPTF